jgi:hypothetical protein
MAGTCKRRCKDTAYGYWSHCCHAAFRPVERSWFRPSSIPRSCMARSVSTTKAVKDKMGIVKKALRSILALHPETALLTFCTGTWATSTRVLIDAKRQRRTMPEHGGWPMARRRCDSHSRVAVVSAGLRWARTGAVMSNPLLSRSSTPEYCQGDCTGKGSTSLA